MEAPKTPKVLIKLKRNLTEEEFEKKFNINERNKILKNPAKYFKPAVGDICLYTNDCDDKVRITQVLAKIGKVYRIRLGIGRDEDETSMMVRRKDLQPYTSPSATPVKRSLR